MERIWFLTWTTYGSWLPGDERGFVSNVRTQQQAAEFRHNEPGTPYDRDMPSLKADVRTKLKGAPVRLTLQQATRLGAQFQKTAAFRGWTLVAFAIMDNHIRLVVGVHGDSEPSKLLGDFKSYGSRCLNREFAKPASGTWWTESGSTRIVEGEFDLHEVVWYVRDPNDPLVVLLNEQAIRSLLEPDWADALLAAHQGADAPRSPAAETA